MTQTRRRSKEDKEMRRAEILSLANLAFVEGGYKGIKMREIARSLDITAAAIYTYFRTKKDIMRALVDQGLNSLRFRMGQIDLQIPFPIFVRQVAWVYFTFADSQPHLYNTVFRQDGEINFLEDKAVEFYKVVYGMIDLWYAENKSKYDNRDWNCGAICEKLWILLHGFIIFQRYVSQNFEHAEKDFENHLEYIVEALKATFSKLGVWTE